MKEKHEVKAAVIERGKLSNYLNALAGDVKTTCLGVIT